MGGVAPFRGDAVNRETLRLSARHPMSPGGVGVLIFCFCLLSIMVSLAWIKEFLRELPAAESQNPVQIEKNEVVTSANSAPARTVFPQPGKSENDSKKSPRISRISRTQH